MIEHKEIMMELDSSKVKENFPGQHPMANICAVCGQYCFYYYYGAHCCEGCKQFFRRCVVKLKMYNCKKENKCEADAENYCRGCRLNRCLLAGMMPRYVRVSRTNERIEQFYGQMEQRRIALLQARLQNPNLSERSNERTLVMLLMELERGFRKFWDSSRPLCPEYMAKFANIADLLESPENLLINFASNELENIKKWDKEQFINEVETCGVFTAKASTIMITDWFGCVEFVKAIPFFKKLDFNDQICLLQQAIRPMVAICSAYYSNKISAQTFTRGDGFCEITILQTRNFAQDKNIRKMCEKIFCHPVERIAQLDLEHNEFLMLLAIMAANPNAENLSASGRDLLYTESVEFAKILQKMLKSRHGHFVAANKFACLIHFLGTFSNTKMMLNNLRTYLEVFYERRDSGFLFPKALLFLNS